MSGHSERDRATRAETVGSMLRPEAVIQAVAPGSGLRDLAPGGRQLGPRQGGDPGGEARQILDRAVIEAIRIQEEAGLDVITDGEMRRWSWAQTPRFLDCFERRTGGGPRLDWRGGAGEDAGHGAGQDTGHGAAQGAAAGAEQGAGQGAAYGPGQGAAYGPGQDAAYGPGQDAAQGAGRDAAQGPGQNAGRPAGMAYPVVVRRVSQAERTGSMAGEYAFLAEHAHTRTKYSMAAPSYHRRYWSDAHSRDAYGSCEEFLTEIRDYLREVAADLVALGCDYIQLDAPSYGSYCDPGTRARLMADGRDIAADLAFDAELDSSLLEGLPDVTTALHICRGNGPGGRWHSAGGYGAISAELFPLLRFDRLLLEYDSDRAGDFLPLEDVPAGTMVVLGLLTTKSGELEDFAQVGERIAEAGGIKPLDELALSTQCGFASGVNGNPLTAEQQRAKLEMVADIAHRTWNGR